MAITNLQIVDALYNIADFLEETGDNPYRVRAYRRAASAIKKYPQDIYLLIENKADLTVINNVGERIAKLIEEMVITNNLNWLPQTKPAQTYPQHLQKRKRKISTFRIYSVILAMAKFTTRLAGLPDVIKLEIVGDLRRKKEVMEQVEIIIVAKNTEGVFEQIYLFPSVRYIVDKSETSTTVQLKTGFRVTITAIEEENFATTLLAKTGSTEHYQHLATIAKSKKYDLATPKVSEADIYHELDLQYIPPELRENRGEIEAAKQHSLPKLVELTDIKGDLHSHTNETDGNFTLEEMVAAAIEQGYQYLAITDHSKSLRITNGMDEKRLLQQIDKINNINAKLSNFTILKAMEVDILEDGSLDLDNSVLKELDLTVCSIHSKFRIPMEQQTERILRAMDNPYFTILGHATGRLINSRPPYQIDLDRILQAAKERNCFIEVNAQPYRLDINDIYCKKAKEYGVKVAISSDAHTTKGFDYMFLGVNQARRGWLETKDVINTFDLINLRKLLKRP